MKIAIIKYNAGNVASVMYALDRIGMNYSWTDEEEEIRAADKVIFPGVGEASTAMAYFAGEAIGPIDPFVETTRISHLHWDAIVMQAFGRKRHDLYGCV